MYTKSILLFLLWVLPLAAHERLALVSMAPYVGMVKDLTQNEVAVELLVPAGFSTHTYEPTPKQIIRATKASIWFAVGELFETRVKAALETENPKLVLIDLREGLNLIVDHHCHECASHDTHIWMSPKMMQKQVEHMAKGLTLVFPDLKDVIEKNKLALIAKLETLDSAIHTLLDSKKDKTVFVSHPAYGYFCREYGLKEDSIEFEGKDPTPKQLYNLIEAAKKEGVGTIFIQKQYSTKAAELVAKEIGAKLVLLDPYSEDYFASMLEIAKQFREAL